MELRRKVLARFFAATALMVLSSFVGPQAFGQSQCPVVRIGENNFATCNANGTASVSLSAELDNPNTDPNDFAIAVIECAPDGVPSGNHTVGVSAGESNVPLTAVCIYPTPSTPQPFIRFTDVNSVPLAQCPPVPIPFGPLSPCEGGCPTIGSIIVDADSETPVIDPLTCDFEENQSWSVALDAVINNKASVTGGYVWNFGDGTPQVSIAATDPGAPRQVHQYQCPGTGDHIVTLTVVGCPGEEFYTDFGSATLNFPSCGCPGIDGIADDINGCTVDFNASIAGSCTDAITEFIWNFGDGETATTLPSDPGDPTQIQHTYDENGTYNVTLILGGVGSGCSFTKEVSVANCAPPNGGDGGDDDGCVLCFCGGLECCLLWVLFIFAALVAIVALATLICNPGSFASWLTFLIALGAAVAAAVRLAMACGVDACALLIGVAVDGGLALLIICHTDTIAVLVSPACKEFLCTSSFTIPGTNFKITWLAVFTLLWAAAVGLFCAAS